MATGVEVSTAQPRFRELIRLHVAPVLRQHGYKGSGQNFHRRIQGNWAVINVQGSRHSTAQEVEFTINLGTASTIVRAEDGFEPDEPPREVDCHWGIRLGALLPQQQDTWWTVRAGMLGLEIEVLGQTIARHLVDTALPELERMSSDRALLDALLDGDAPSRMSPASMDVVGPLLRQLGPPDRFARYLERIDRNGGHAARLYTLWDEDPPARLGPRRVAQRLERIDVGGVRRIFAIVELGFATPTDEIRRALRPLLDDADGDVRGAAAAALGRLGDVAVAPNLLAMVADEPARRRAVDAAFALARLDPELPPGERSRVRDVIVARRERAVGHDRGALSELLRRMGSSPGT